MSRNFLRRDPWHAHASLLRLMLIFYIPGQLPRSRLAPAARRTMAVPGRGRGVVRPGESARGDAGHKQVPDTDLLRERGSSRSHRVSPQTGRVPAAGARVESYS